MKEPEEDKKEKKEEEKNPSFVALRHVSYLRVRLITHSLFARRSNRS